MNRWRLPTKLGLFVGIPVLCVLAVAVVGYREVGRLNQDVARMVTVTSKANALVSDLRTNIQLGRRMEFRAVLSRDNTETQTFADDRARGTRQVDEGYRALVAALTKSSPTSDERQCLERFRAAWEEYSPSRARTLELAGEKSNVKAQQVTKGRLADKVHEIDETAKSWLRQLDKDNAEMVAAKDIQRLLVAKENRQAVCRLQAIALDLHRQLSQQVLAANEDEIGVAGGTDRRWFKEADAKLAELASQSDVQDAPRLDALSGAFRALGPLVAQMQSCLRANTTDRSKEMIQASNRNIDDSMSALTQLADDLDGQLQGRYDQR